MILDCQNICKSFGTDVILNNISFHLEEKEKMAIVGINGAGKTTLLKIIMGEEEADSGQVIISKDRTIGYLSQYQESNYNTTVRGVMLDALKPILELQDKMRKLEAEMENQSGETLEKSLELYNRYTHEFEYKNGYSCESEANGVLKGLGFSKEDYDRHTDSLSGGQRTRLALGRLLMVKPDIIILDEPTAGQDFKHYTEIMEFLVDLNKKGVTILMVTHDMHLMLEYTNKVIVLSEGEKIADNIPAYILTNKEIIEKANLKETSLHQLALKCDIEDTTKFVNKFIDYDRRVR